MLDTVASTTKPCLLCYMYLEENEPAREEVSGDLCVHGARMKGAHSHTTPRDTLSKFPGKHDVGQLTSAVGQSRAVPKHKE